MSKSIIKFVLALGTTAGVAAACPAIAAQPIGGLGNARHVTIWVPDFYGHNVIDYMFYYTSPNATPTFSSLVLKLPNSKSGSSASPCNPNGLAMHGNELYIVCNSDEGGPDVVFGYNTSSHSYKEISGSGTDGHNYFDGAH